MKRIILVIVFSLWTLLSWAKIDARLSESSIHLGQSFNLILSQDDRADQQIPDLTALQKDFHILGTERSVNYTLMNGQSSTVSQWVIVLRAKRTGQLSIPAIPIGRDKSEPLSIDVKSSSNTVNTSNQGNAAPADQDENTLLLTQATPDAPYVNQEVIYSVKVMTRKQIINSDYFPPQVEDALTVPLGKARSYQEDYRGETYLVEEQRYAVFPQKSGKLKIISPIFNALVYNFVPEKIRLQDKNKLLEVKPIPSQYQGSYWLPAKKIVLSERYDPETAELKQGDTLTREISIEARGLPAQLLPKIKLDDNQKAYNLYPEKARESNIVRKNELIGISKIKVTYLFNKAGQIKIPTLKIHWFNTETQQEEVASLPEKMLSISPSANAATNTAKPASPKPETPTTDKKTNPQPKVEIPQAGFNIAWLTAGIFAFAWLITLFFWFQQKSPKQKLRQKRKIAICQLQQACKNNDSHRAEQALLTWAASQWPSQSIMNLALLKNTIPDRKLQAEIQKLSQARYAQNPQSNWQGNTLWQAFSAFKTERRKSRTMDNPLPPIYPGV